MNSTSESGINSMVCETCRDNLFNTKSFQEAWEKDVTYNTNWANIRQSYNKGCSWCDLVYYQVAKDLATMDDPPQTFFQGSRESIRAHARSIREDEMIVFVTFQNQSSERGDRCDFAVRYKKFEPDLPKVRHVRWGAGQVCTMLTATFCTPSGDNAASFIPVRPMVREMASPNTFQLARDCLEECTRRSEGHEDCAAYSPTTLPTRVLDVRLPECPKLFITNGLKDRYTALSYVWGEAQTERTTILNMDSYIEHGLHMEKTPQTIKDAIRVTHELGLRYLWIDSFCILQDSDTDKAKEIGRMRQVYQDAYVTIIAAKASRVSEGFLQNCTMKSPSYIVPYCCADGKLGSMTLLPGLEEEYRQMEVPVDTRGWCLQERILSSRSLVYAPHTLQYQCQRGVFSVGNSHNMYSLASDTKLSRQFFYKNHDKGTGNSPPSSKELRKLTDLWGKVVQDYTNRQVSVASDKLNAISGIADDFQRYLGGSRYLAGLWEHSLLRDLLWKRSQGTPLPRPIPKEPSVNAPSWSWASINGRVDPGLYFKRSAVFNCEIIDCQVQPKDQNAPFGETASGSLKLRARAKEVLWCPDDTFIHQQKSNGEFVRIAKGYLDAVDNLIAMKEENSVLALPLVLKTVDSPYEPVRRSGGPERNLLGLLVVKDKIGEWYRRVGYFDCRFENTSEEVFAVGEQWELTIR